MKKETTDSVLLTASFEKIIIKGKGKFKILIKQCKQNGYKIEAASDQLGLINIQNDKNYLKILGDEKLDKDEREIFILIHIKTIQEFNSSSITNIQFENQIIADSLLIEATGINNITGSLLTKKINICDSGINNFVLNGKAENLYLKKSGIGTFNGLDLEVQEGIVHVFGIGKVCVNLIRSAELYASGLSMILYKGNPEFKRINRNGFAKIEQL